MKNVPVLICLVVSLLFVAMSLPAGAITLDDIRVHYKFDDTTGDVFTDSGPNGLNATFYRPLKYEELPGLDISNVSADLSPLDSSSYIGLGTRIVGSTEQQVMVRIPPSTSLPGTGDSFAVSFWLTVDNWANSTLNSMIASYNLNDLEWSIGRNIGATGRISVWSGDADVGGTSAWSANCSSLAYGFHHFVLQFEGTAGVTGLYVDGVLAADEADGALWGNEHEAFVLGARVLDARDFTIPSNDPSIEDFAVISGTVDAADISNLMTVGASSLGARRLAHYTMDQTTGTQLIDSSSNANHATLVSYDPTTMGADVRGIDTALRTGVFGNAIEIVSNESKVNRAERAVLPSVDTMPAGGEAFTVCFWMRPDEVIASNFGWDASGVAFGWSNTVEGLEGLGFSVGMDTRWNGSLLVRRTTGDYTSVDDQDTYCISLGADSGETTGLNLDPTVFHHFAVTVDAEGIITGIYVDGNFVASQYENGWGITDEETGVIGARIKNGTVDGGICAYLDDLAVISGVLTESDIRLAMNQGVEALLLPPAQIPGDTNGDRKVDEEDAKKLAANWSAPVTAGDVTKGDFNGDGAVNAL
ncbi:MAG TPA: hypothetical protein DD670_13615, partial [Planctomycetaceae bacterium]|nr:hypothetical protein [Planctomycetaceae bacterium]